MKQNHESTFLSGTVRTIAAFAAVVMIAAPAHGRGETYVSPFAVSLSPDIADWTSDFAARAALIVANASPACSDSPVCTGWYEASASSSVGSYGPRNPLLISASSADATLLSALAEDRGGPVYGVAMNSVPKGVGATEWQQQRLVQAAAQLIGTHYQHLHLPTFDPRLAQYSFDWSAVSTNATLQTTQELDANQPGTAPNPYRKSYGSAQPGIDCTDLSAYVYNIALGIQMRSGTPTQVGFTSGTMPSTSNEPQADILGNDGTAITPTFFVGPNYGTMTKNGAGSLDAIVAELEAGDLLYMISSEGKVTHVVMWLGQYGVSTDPGKPAPPLVISSHDNTPAIFDTVSVDATTGFPTDGDTDGHLPPPGVQILPFDETNWFYRNFSFAMRVLPPCTPACAGDFDCSGSVDAGDLAALLGAWGPCGAGACPCDVNDDGMVNAKDLATILVDWGSCGAPRSASRLRGAVSRGR